LVGFVTLLVARRIIRRTIRKQTEQVLARLEIQQRPSRLRRACRSWVRRHWRRRPVRRCWSAASSAAADVPPRRGVRFKPGTSDQQVDEIERGLADCSRGCPRCGRMLRPRPRHA
jgi:hypothetical protein